jgi:hypothetical protein
MNENFIFNAKQGLIGELCLYTSRWMANIKFINAHDKVFTKQNKK